MRIGLDIDGVMYQWDRTARYMLREVIPNIPAQVRNEENLKQESSHWNWIESQVTKEEWRWLWAEGVRLGLFRYGHLYPGTIEAVRELAKLGDVILITNRTKNAVQDTLAWAAYLQLPISGIHFVPRNLGKSTVLPWCDAYLDDKPENCVELRRETGAVVKLMSRPWNVSHPAVLERVHSWDEFIDAVKEIA